MDRVLVVSPALNEETGISSFVEAIEKLRQALVESGIDLRLLVVNDGSTDGTLGILRELCRGRSEWLSFLSFTHRFGYQPALIAGMINAGEWPEAIITMDSDLEHPLSKVPELIAEWKRSRAIVVHTLREEARELPLQKRILSKCFYRITSFLTGLELQAGQADFRLWDARILRSIQHYLPNVGSLRVFAAWIPGKKSAVQYRQEVAPRRISRFDFSKNLELAVLGVVRFSDLPLRLITIFGIIGLTFSALYAAFIFLHLYRGLSVSGWTSTILTVIAMGCLQLVSLGILAGYFRRIVFAKDLPLYIIEEKSP